MTTTVINEEKERSLFESAMARVFEEPCLSRRGNGYHHQVIAFYWDGWLLRAELDGKAD